MKTAIKSALFSLARIVALILLFTVSWKIGVGVAVYVAAFVWDKDVMNS